MKEKRITTHNMKKQRVGQIAADDLKDAVLAALQPHGLLLAEIMALPAVVAEINACYGDLDPKTMKKAKHVIQNFLLCGLDERIKREDSRFAANPGGADGRKSVTRDSVARVTCLQTGRSCLVKDVLRLGRIMYGQLGNDGFHAALLQNNGRGNVFKTYTADLAEGVGLTPEAAFAFLQGAEMEHVDEGTDIEEPETEEETIVYELEDVRE
jgi:hypothetical protein